MFLCRSRPEASQTHWPMPSVLKYAAIKRLPQGDSLCRWPVCCRHSSRVSERAAQFMLSAFVFFIVAAFGFQLFVRWRGDRRRAWGRGVGCKCEALILPLPCIAIILTDLLADRHRYSSRPGRLEASEDLFCSPCQSWQTLFNRNPMFSACKGPRL